MNILFVSHAATRGGASGVLLDLLRFIRSETPHQSTLLCARSGPLEAEFARFAAPFSHPRPFQLATRLAGAKRRLSEMSLPRQSSLECLLSGVTRQTERRARHIARALPRFDVVFANSAASGDAVRPLEPLLRRGARLVVHVHELSYALSQNEPGWSFLRQRGDFFLAASNAVREELIQHQNIPAEKIEVIHEWLDFTQLQTDTTEARRALRAQIQAPDDAVLIGGCGTIEPRKGTDWWVQSAFHALGTVPNARKTPAPLHFVWLGGGDNPFARAVARDAHGFGIQNNVHFLPSSPQPHHFFAALDVFCLSSREDPFPLVAVEAAAQSVPLTCFVNSGGAPELIAQNGGVIVPWGDCAAMGRALASLGRDADYRTQLGRNVHSRARALCDAPLNCARVVAILEAQQ